MAKRRSKVKPAKSLSTSKFSYEEQPFSFDTDAILCIAGLWYAIENTIKDKAVERSNVKKCIPKSTIVEVAKELGLTKWLKELPDEE